MWVVMIIERTGPAVIRHDSRIRETRRPMPTDAYDAALLFESEAEANRWIYYNTPRNPPSEGYAMHTRLPTRYEAEPLGNRVFDADFFFNGEYVSDRLI